MQTSRTFTSWMQLPVVMDLQVACIILGCSYDNLQKAAKHGGLPAFRNSERKWTVKKEDLIAYMEQQKVDACSSSHQAKALASKATNKPTDEEILAMSNVLPTVAAKYINETPVFVRLGFLHIPGCCNKPPGIFIINIFVETT